MESAPKGAENTNEHERPAALSAIAKQEGFTTVHELKEWDKAVLDSLDPGSFHVVLYSEGEVAENPEKKGWASKIFYKAPDGTVMEKSLLGERSEYGWTDAAADALIKAIEMEPEEVASKDESLKDRDARAVENGFTAGVELTESQQAFLKSMKPGELLKLRYPDSDIEATPGKQGYIHSILYCGSDGTFYRKSLTGTSRQYGWTYFEANALVNNMKKQAE